MVNRGEERVELKEKLLACAPLPCTPLSPHFQPSPTTQGPGHYLAGHLPKKPGGPGNLFSTSHTPAGEYTVTGQGGGSGERERSSHPLGPAS